MRKGRSIRVLGGAIAVLMGGASAALATVGSPPSSRAGRAVTAAVVDPGSADVGGTVRKISPWPRPARVAVPVADVWDRADSARPMDARATGADPDMAGWLATLDYAAKLDLDNRLATQALLGDPVVVLAQSGSWVRVRLTAQRGTVWPRGVEGWMAADQVTYQPAPQSLGTVTVTVARLAVAGRVLSYGTRLPVLGSTSGQVVVSTPAGPAPVPAGDVRAGPFPASGPAVVAQAERFIGLPYLWAGTSSFGFDCSGLTLMVYRQFGVDLPRDAADQQAAGTPVGRADLQPGDLVFYSFGGTVDHVGIYAGDGRMIDSPQTGGAVEVVPMWGTPLAAHFAGAARYLHAA